MKLRAYLDLLLMAALLGTAFSTMAQESSTTMPPPPEIREESPADLTTEEQTFLEEEYSPPREPPYTNDEPQQSRIPTPPPAPPPPSGPVPYRYDGLKKITAKGEYIYKVEESTQNYAAGFRGGQFIAPNLIVTLSNGQKLDYQDIYGDAPQFIGLFDFEWQFFKRAGKLGVRLGSGFSVATGNGRFKRDTSKQALEQYTFYFVPNSAALIYRAMFWDRQPLVPYGFAGASYFGMIEDRDDEQPMRYAGAAATQFGAGLAFMLDWLDREAANELDKDHGVNHVYVNAEYQYTIGLNQKYDLTGDYITAGFTVEF